MPIPIAAAVGLAVGSMFGIEATREFINYGVWMLLPFKNFEPGDAVELRHRTLIDKERYTKIMKMYGYNKFKAEMLFDASRRLIEINDLVTLKWRGDITEEEFNRRAEYIRAGEKERELIEKAMRYFPSPNDLITMAVREVFTPDIVETFQLDADLPEQFLELAGKVGLSEEMATWNWRAHWILPSISSGFEMFHRRIITRDELTLLLRTLDIMPFWRDKLINLSYTPLTRVDVRRMYALGVLDREGVYSAYLDEGYSPQNAELMTQFTEKYVLPEEKELTKTEIKKFFEIGEFDENETIAALGTLGYPEIIATFIVALWDYELTMKVVDAQIDVWQTQVVDGIITLEELQANLAGLNLNATRIEQVLTETRHSVLKALKLPSKEDLKAWLANFVIDQPTFKELMTRNGYLEEHIALYIKEITGEEPK